MSGFQSAHGTSPCLFGGEFLDLSIVHDDERPVGKVSVLDLPDTSPSKPEEPFDHDLELTVWSSLALGADADWDDGDDATPEESVEDWLQRRYGDVIKLNEQFGYAPTSNVVPIRPSFVGQTRTNVRQQHWSDKCCLREQSLTYDKRRGKAGRK